MLQQNSRMASPSVQLQKYFREPAVGVLLQPRNFARKTDDLKDFGQNEENYKCLKW